MLRTGYLIARYAESAEPMKPLAPETINLGLQFIKALVTRTLGHQKE
jgi:hypothetical protein